MQPVYENAVEHPDFRRMSSENIEMIWWWVAIISKMFGGEPGEYAGFLTLRMNRCLHSFDVSRGWQFSTYYATRIPPDVVANVLAQESEAWAIRCKNNIKKEHVQPLGNAYHLSALDRKDDVGKTKAYDHPWKEPPPEEWADQIIGLYETREDLWKALTSTCSPRERTLLRMRFEEGKSLREIGEFFGFTKERARQVQVEALRVVETKLRKIEVARDLFFGEPAEGSG